MSQLRVLASGPLADKIHELYGIEAHPGDTAVAWPAEATTTDEQAMVTEAERIFTELRKAGMTAFRVDSPTAEPVQITEFDRTAPEILMIPAIQGGA